MELSTAPGKHPIDQIAALKVPVFALTGNPDAEEPCCSYLPKGCIPQAQTVKNATTLHLLKYA